MEAGIAAWFDTKTLDVEKTVARVEQGRARPSGRRAARHQAWRKNISGIVRHGPQATAPILDSAPTT